MKNNTQKVTNFNNVFAVFVVSLVFGTTILDGAGKIKIADMVMGSMWTSGFTLVIQFFFRKRVDEADPPAPPTPVPVKPEEPAVENKQP